MLKLLLAIVLLVGCGNSDDVRRVNAHDALQVKARLLERAHRCTIGYYAGYPCNDKQYRGVKSNDYGDTDLYTNLLCLSGQRELCLPPTRLSIDSRDMAVGLVAYLATTKDAETLNVFKDHFKSSVCFDECTKTRTIEDLLARVGIHNQRRLGSGLIEAELLTEAQTAPAGYQLRLVADKVIVYHKLGLHFTSRIGKILYHRQSCNPYFRWLAYGSYDLKQLDVVGSNKYWRFSPSCAEVDVKMTNHWNEIYLINLTLAGIR